MRKRSLFGTREQLAEESPINLTPLIDVVFVVLIMFIIIAPILEIDHVQLASAARREEKDKTAALESSSIAIHVHADDTIWFNAKIVSTDQLLPLLKDARRKSPQRTPQLFHDKKAHFGTYQNVKNTVELAGFEQMDVILQPH
jgi:biopolymer transport protein ExbD